MEQLLFMLAGGVLGGIIGYLKEVLGYKRRRPGVSQLVEFNMGKPIKKPLPTLKHDAKYCKCCDCKRHNG